MMYGNIEMHKIVDGRIEDIIHCTAFTVDEWEEIGYVVVEEKDDEPRYVVYNYVLYGEDNEVLETVTTSHPNDDLEMSGFQLKSVEEV